MPITLPRPKRVVIIGLGGIGSPLSTNLSRIFAFTSDLKGTEIVLVDGDTYEAKNAERQEASGLRNKAEATQAELERKFPYMKFTAVSAYIGKEAAVTDDGIIVVPASKIIQEGDWVFGCVDNNKTRLIVSQRVQELTNGVLIDGGNEKDDGSVMLFIRHEGKDLTPPIESYQPQIETPEDKAPYEMSCEELAHSGFTQILVTNLFAALMCIGTLWRLLEPVEPSEIACIGFFELANILSKEDPTMAFRQRFFKTPVITVDKETNHV